MSSSTPTTEPALTTDPAPTTDPVPTDPKRIAARLTPEELAVAEKALARYSLLDTSKDRLTMLREEICPKLLLLNTHLSAAAWGVRKSQIKVWFQSHARGTSLRSRLSFTKKVSIKQVACHKYKSEIATIATERANGARPGSQEWLPVFQGAVDEWVSGLDEAALAELETMRADWISRGQPVEVKRKTAERMGETYIEQMATVLYKEMGIRFVLCEWHENKAGTKLFQIHDFNDKLGKVKLQSFRDKCPDAANSLKSSLMDYMRYTYRVEEGAEIDTVAQNRISHTLLELDRDVKGYPLLPVAQQGDGLHHLKRLIRSFVTAHYRFASGRRQDRVPWKQIKEHTSDFIEAKYLPDEVFVADPKDRLPQLDDPSDMKKEQVTRLLDHWRRPVAGSDLFRFSHVLVNSKADEMTPALYTDSLGPQTLPQNARPAAPVSIPVHAATHLDLDEEYHNANPEEEYQFSPGPDGDVNMSQLQPIDDMTIDPVLRQVEPPAPKSGPTGRGRKPAPKAPKKNKPKPKKSNPKPSAKAGEAPDVNEATDPAPIPRPKPKPVTKKQTAKAGEAPDDNEATGPAPIPRPKPKPVTKKQVPHADVSQPDLSPAVPQPDPSTAPEDTHSGNINSDEPAGRSRRPMKRKLDAYSAWEAKDAAEKARKAPVAKRPHTK